MFERGLRTYTVWISEKQSNKHKPYDVCAYVCMRVVKKREKKGRLIDNGEKKEK